MRISVRENWIRFCSWVLCSLLLAVLLSGIRISADAAYTASVDVRQVFRIYRSSGLRITDSFPYKVTALNGAPSGNEQTFTLKENETKRLYFSFDRPGDDEYQLKLALPGKEQYYSYDEAVYKIRIYTKAGEPVVIIYDEDGNKISGILYQHSFTAPENPDPPKTGDDSGIIAFVFLLPVSAAGIFFLRKGQRK